MNASSAAWTFPIVLALGTIAVAAALSGAMILVLRPWLQRYAMATPNARSSHKVPTPQGGGAAVVASTLLCGGAAILALGGFAGADNLRFASVFGAAAILAAVGVADDILTLHPLPRLLLQLAAVALVIATLPGEQRVISHLPWRVERGLLVLGGVWFVNAVNFMDGMDWMTVAEAVPITAGLAILGGSGALAPAEVAVALALCGAMLGFAPFNRPVAKLFLGDVGSLPIGLLLGWLLLMLAVRGQIVAALLLPLYYLADAGITLLRRAANGEKIWEAHRSHFYQRASDAGLAVPQIVGRVFAANAGLVVLAIVSAAFPAVGVSIAALVLGTGLVGVLLVSLRRGSR